MLSERVVQFIHSQKVATICCVDEQNKPYSFSCFYTFDRINCRLIFKSSITSRHSQLILEKPHIAGTILPDRLNILSLKGIQFSGITLSAAEADMHYARNLYHLKFPFAMAITGNIYAIQLDAIKMTDNAVEFGRKITWQRNMPDASNVPEE
jgi:uncharacterized protein YhbP (UPF0306 family)